MLGIRVFIEICTSAYFNYYIWWEKKNKGAFFGSLLLMAYSWLDVLISGGNAGDGGVICGGNGSIMCGFADAVKRGRENWLHFV